MSSAVNEEYQAVCAFELDHKDAYTGNMEKGKPFRQYLVAVIANISSIAVGTTLGWTSPIGAKINAANETDTSQLDDSPLERGLFKDEASLVASLLPIGALIAPYAAGPLADFIGRKWTLLASTVFFVLSFVLLITTQTVAQIYAARLIQGFGVGFVMTVTPMYCGEIPSTDARGAIGSFMQLFIVTGILYVYCVGPYVSYYLTQYICMIVPVVFAATYFFMPESPYYYIAKGNKEGAIESLKYLRGKTADGIQEELAQIQTTIDEAMKSKARMIDVFTSKGNRKAFIICAGLLVFQQLSGINVVLFFNQKIFDAAGGSMDPAIASIIVGVVQVIASGCTPLVADRLGRRIILLASAAGMCVALALLGLFFYFTDIESPAVDSISWLPIVSLIIFVLVYCVGFGPLPWAVLGEMFPANVKSYASSIVASICWILGFVITQYFSALSDVIGMSFSFWLFSVFCACGFLFTFTLVMETKGLSLQQIQDKLNAK